jgi:flagellar protein FlgJ
VDLATAQRLISAADSKSLAALKQHGTDPAAAKAAAGQFAALLVQNVMQGSDGTALPVAGDDTGGNIVSGLFANAISQMAASGDKLGLADLLFRSIEEKQRLAGGGAKAPTAGAPPGAPGNFRALGSHQAQGFALRPYWQQGGGRPLVAAAPGSTEPASGPAAALTAMPAPGRLGAAWPGNAPAAASGSASSPVSAGDDLGRSSSPAAKVQSFVRQLRPMMVEAGRQLGVSPRILLAHAALETGWGRSVVGNNLFGIKAGATWQGDQFTTLTHEVEEGQRVARDAAFRAYPSLDASVQDYVALIGGNPRYQGLIGLGDDAEAYGRGLMAGGYASDTDYGGKLEAVAAEAAAAFAEPSPPGPTGPLPPFGLFATPRWTE